MSIEYAGAVVLDPPLTGDVVAWLADASIGWPGGWLVSRDGSRLRPRQGSALESSVSWLRTTLEYCDGVTEAEGRVAAYDTDTEQLVMIRVRGGRVTRRTVQRRAHLERVRSNVVDLAARRRTTTRALPDGAC